LLPWHWRWAHAVPVEGVMGRLVAGMLVAYLNIQGAWIVATVLAAAGFYFASAINFWAVKETLADRWIQMQWWYDRWRNWRGERADPRAAGEGEVPGAQDNPGPSHTVFNGADGAEAPAAGARSASAEAFAEMRGGAGVPSQVSESRPGAPNPVAESRKFESPVAETRPVAPTPVRPDPTPTQVYGNGISIHERADADVRTTTVAPRNVSGFKLPPSTLLNTGGGPQAIREDELREEAKVLVEKCGEF